MSHAIASWIQFVYTRSDIPAALHPHAPHPSTTTPSLAALVPPPPDPASLPVETHPARPAPDLRRREPDPTLSKPGPVRGEPGQPRPPQPNAPPPTGPTCHTPPAPQQAPKASPSPTHPSPTRTSLRHAIRHTREEPAPDAIRGRGSSGRGVTTQRRRSEPSPPRPKPRQNAPRAASRVFWKKLLPRARPPIQRPTAAPPHPSAWPPYAPFDAVLPPSPCGRGLG